MVSRLLVAVLLAFLPAVPVASASRVATDADRLAVADAQRRAYILCANRRATARHRAFEPRRCNTLGPRQPFAAAVNLARLRWSGWGREVATARGIELGFRLRESRIPVRVRASGRRVGCRGDWVYTRLRVRSRYGTTVVRLPTRCP